MGFAKQINGYVTKHHQNCDIVGIFEYRKDLRARDILDVCKRVVKECEGKEPR